LKMKKVINCSCSIFYRLNIFGENLMNKLKKILVTSITAATMMTAVTAHAGVCNDVTFAEFKTAMKLSYEETQGAGFSLPMWATLMNKQGKICYVSTVKGLDEFGAGTAVGNGGAESTNNAWLGSRVISAQKAFTANAFSLDGLAISSGALSVTVYPGGSLYGLQHSNPVDATEAYAGDPSTYGTSSDPLMGKTIGGVNVFGGAVALYDGGVKVGAVGASGDTSCRDHTFAYRMRVNLGLDTEPNDDGLAQVGNPAALFEIPACGVNDPSVTVYQAADDNGIRSPAP